MTNWSGLLLRAPRRSAASCRDRRGLQVQQAWVTEAVINVRRARRPHSARPKTGLLSVASTSGLLLASLLANPQQTRAAVMNATDANPLVRDVIQNEIQAETNDNDLWSYRELTKRKGKELLLEYCQTKYGTIHRLLAVNGHPLSPRQRQAEDQRIQKLIRSPNELRAAQNKESADAREERKFLKLFPAAFRYQEEQAQGDRITFRFTPNPSFHPSGNEQRVLHALTGTMVVDVRQKRLVSIEGRLMTEVKFWGGFLGHLDRGGTFSVVSENVSPGDWELKSLDIEMNGKALLFKTLAIREHDTYTSYTPVPPSASLAQAAERLRQDSSG
jgi:hypothetical protein